MNGNKYKFIIIFRALLFLLLISIGLSGISLAVSGAEEAQIPCQSSSKAYAVYLYNVETESTLFEKNIYNKISPASTVKLMTAMVAFDNISDVNKTVTITEAMIGGATSNTMKLKAGENIKIADLFSGLVCSGNNDAANALAVIAKGSVSSFVDAMNEKAKALGATDTVYVDPTGINDTAQTTAYDTMLVADAFMGYEFLLETSTSPSKEVQKTNLSEKRTLHNRNAMISNRSGSRYLNSNAIGMNAGMTSGGGYCVVTSMKQDDMTYICVVMGGTYDEGTDTTYSYVVANELLSYIDRNLGYRSILSAGEEITTLPVVGATINKTHVSVCTDNDVLVYLPSDYLESPDFQVSYIYTKNKLVAPLKIGDVVGKIIVRYNGEILSVSNITVAEDVPRDNFMYLMTLTRDLIFSRGFIASVVCFVSLFFGRVFLRAYSLRSKRQKNKKSMNKYN